MCETSSALGINIRLEKDFTVDMEKTRKEVEGQKNFYESGGGDMIMNFEIEMNESSAYEGMRNKNIL